MLVIGIIVVCFLVLFVYSSCVVSGRCAREEEKELK